MLTTPFIKYLLIITAYSFTEVQRDGDFLSYISRMENLQAVYRHLLHRPFNPTAGFNNFYKA